ncbi:MAG: hypothetical protein KDK08_05190 [Rhizobiaceae bacterium]|nr:hypothetical protein [Rhizobiaceae bacterium]MCC0000864.1 hypothetical protein [Methylobacteriaceae bacterium]
MNDLGIEDYDIQRGGKHFKLTFTYRGMKKLVVLSGSPRTEHAAERISRDVRNVILRSA